MKIIIEINKWNKQESKKVIKLTETDIKNKLVDTFQVYSYDVTNFDVWYGIHNFFANTFIQILQGLEIPAIKDKKIIKYPKKYKKLIFGLYYKEKD